jgi:hypothetical protein
MNHPKLGIYAASLVSALLSAEALAEDMDVYTTKGKDGREYFCANASCAGNASCKGAGNATCGSRNKCANTSQGYLSGWFWAENKESCEKGKGKWMLYKKEYGFNNGNKPPFGTAKKSTP